MLSLGQEAARDRPVDQGIDRVGGDGAPRESPLGDRGGDRVLWHHNIPRHAASTSPTSTTARCPSCLRSFPSGCRKASKSAQSALSARPPQTSQGRQRNHGERRQLTSGSWRPPVRAAGRRHLAPRPPDLTQRETRRLRAHQRCSTACPPAALCRRWLNGGRIEGHEFVARNPRRADQHLGSFKVNLRTGKWADFALADARGGDPVSLAAYLGGLSQVEAARQLVAMLEVEHD